MSGEPSGLATGDTVNLEHSCGWTCYTATIRVGRRVETMTFFAPDRAAAEARAARIVADPDWSSRVSLVSLVGGRS